MRSYTRAYGSKKRRQRSTCVPDFLLYEISIKNVVETVHDQEPSWSEINDASKLLLSNAMATDK